MRLSWIVALGLLAGCSDSGGGAPGADSGPDLHSDAGDPDDAAADGGAQDARDTPAPDLDDDTDDALADLADSASVADADTQDASDVPDDLPAPNCDTFALVSEAYPTLPLRNQLIGATGGSGQRAWAFAAGGNHSGGSVGAETGQYLSGSVEGVTDLVEVTDTACALTLTASIPIVYPASIAPLQPTVPASRTLCFEASGGTSDLESVDDAFSWEVSIAGSGPEATVDRDGCYTAGPSPGVDIVRLEDRLTGQLLQVAVTVVDDAGELTLSPPRVLIVAADTFDVTVQGGTGQFEWTFEAPPATGTELLAVDGAPDTLRLHAGTVAGSDFVRVRDVHFPDIVGHLEVGVMATVHHDPTPYGAHGDDMDIAAIGDINGDGFPDFAAGTSQSGVNGSYSGALYIYLGNGAGFDVEPVQVIAGFRRYDRLGRQFAAGDFNSDGCGDIAVGVWGEPLAGAERGEVRVYTGCNTDPVPDGQRIDYEHRLSDNLTLPDVEPLVLYDRIQGGQANSDRFGYAVAAGDFDGDGDDDIVATASQAETAVWVDPNRNEPYSNLGRAYVFYQGDGGFEDLANIFIDGVHLSPEGEVAARAENYFGYDLRAVDLNGDACVDLVVGSGRSDDSHGYASVYLSAQSEQSPSGCRLSPLPAVTINPSEADRIRPGRLGYVVRSADFDGDCVADLAVNQYTGGVSGNNGRFHVFLNHGWSADAPQYLTTDDAEVSFEADANDQFAFSLATGDIDGDGTQDILANGRYSEDVGTIPNLGEIRVFRGLIDGRNCAGRDGDEPLFAAPEIGVGEADLYIGFFGQRMAVVPDADGDDIADVVQFSERGRNSDDVLDQTGSVLWRPSEQQAWDFPTWQRLERPDPQHDDHLGWRTERVGDVNADGFDDFIITADGYDLVYQRNGYLETHSAAGAAYLLFGARDGLGSVPDMIVAHSASHSASDRFGYSAAGIGDFDGDGIDDFAVGAPFDDNNGICVACRDGGYINDGGSVMVYLGREGLGVRREPGDPMPELTDPDYVICAPQIASLRIARELVGGGDVNGDGLADIASANWNADGARGTVYVAFGTDAGGSPGVVCMDESAALGSADGGGDNLGYGLGITDLDGDGCAEVIAGAPNDDFDGRGNAGSLHVWRGAGGPGCPEVATRVVFVGDRAGDNIGYRLTVLGDLNDDGVAELAVGSSGYGVTNYGAVVIVDGARLGLALTTNDGAEIPLVAEYLLARLITPAQAAGTGFGYDLDTLGDVDGDGRPDLIVGERYFSQANILRRGAAYVYLSDASPEALAQPDLVLPGSGRFANGEFGAAVTGGMVGTVTTLVIGAWFAEWEGPADGEMGEVYIGHTDFRGR